MIRVGFALGGMWMGGVTYYRNLLTAVTSLPDCRVEPVLFVPEGADAAFLSGLPDVEVVRSPWFDQFSPRWIARKATQHALKADPLLARFLRGHRIDVLSHADILGSRGGIPALCWIPDLQHRQLPHLFKRSERLYRDWDFRLQGRHADRIILSSEAARSDLAVFAPGAVARSEVLRFVAQPRVTANTSGRRVLEQRYGFGGPYFHVPNQLWAHKNHRLILQALRVLKDAGEPAVVLSTGATEDYRQPGYFGALMAEARALGVEDRFRVCGLVPLDDLVGLMLNAQALINPSRAEGWSTSVEEGKSLGKRVVLSDIAVHREQAPPGGLYVDPDDAPALAAAMRTVASEHDDAMDAARMLAAREALPGRVRAFGEAYQRVVVDAVMARCVRRPARHGTEPGRDERVVA